MKINVNADTKLGQFFFHICAYFQLHLESIFTTIFCFQLPFSGWEKWASLDFTIFFVNILFWYAKSNIFSYWCHFLIHSWLNRQRIFDWKQFNVWWSHVECMYIQCTYKVRTICEWEFHQDKLLFNNKKLFANSCIVHRKGQKVHNEILTIQCLCLVFKILGLMNRFYNNKRQIVN